MLLLLLACAPAVAPEPTPAPATRRFLDDRVGPAALRDILEADAGAAELDAALKAAKAASEEVDEAIEGVTDVIEVTLPVDHPPEPRRPAGTSITDEPGEAPPDVAAILTKYRGRVQACVDQSWKAHPGRTGRIAVEFTIAAGRVTDAALTANTTGDDALGQCVVRTALRTMRFEHETMTTATWAWRLPAP